MNYEYACEEIEACELLISAAVPIKGYTIGRFACYCSVVVRVMTVNKGHD